MTENHTYDKAALEKIERLLLAGKQTGDELLDSLAATAPKANPDFRQSLEGRLLVALQQQAEQPTERIPDTMEHTLAAFPDTHRSAFRPPLTLAVAMILTLLASAALFVMSGGPPPETDTPFAAGAGQVDASPTFTVTPTITATGVHTATPTITATARFTAEPFATASPIFPPPTTFPPTVAPPIGGQAPGGMPAGLQAVVIALEELPRGATIRAEHLAQVFWPAEIIPDASLPEISSAAGLLARRDVARWQPLLAGDVTTDSSQLAAIDLDDLVILEVPFDRVLIEGFAPFGEPVDVVATLRLVPVDEFSDAANQQPLATLREEDIQFVRQQLIDGAILVAPQGIGDESPDQIRLAVTPEQAVVLAWLIEAEVPLTLIPVVAGE